MSVEQTGKSVPVIMLCRHSAAASLGKCGHHQQSKSHEECDCFYYIDDKT